MQLYSVFRVLPYLSLETLSLRSFEERCNRLFGKRSILETTQVCRRIPCVEVLRQKRG